MPKKSPPEFKRDVVTVARRGDLSVAAVAADIDEGVQDGLTAAEQHEVVRLRRENRRLK